MYSNHLSVICQPATVILLQITVSYRDQQQLCSSNQKHFSDRERGHHGGGVVGWMTEKKTKMFYVCLVQVYSLSGRSNSPCQSASRTFSFYAFDGEGCFGKAHSLLRFWHILAWGTQCTKNTQFAGEKSEVYSSAHTLDCQKYWHTPPNQKIQCKKHLQYDLMGHKDINEQIWCGRRACTEPWPQPDETPLGWISVETVS